MEVIKMKPDWRSLSLPMVMRLSIPMELIAMKMPMTKKTVAIIGKPTSVKEV